MKTVFKNIAIIGKYNTPDMRDTIVAMLGFLSNYPINLYLEDKTANHCKIDRQPTIKISEIGGQVDLAIVIGGDGTMLAVARALADSDIPLVGVNQGRVGFLTDISAVSMFDSMASVLAGEYTVEQRIMLSAKILRKGVEISHGKALNDVVINKTGMSRLIELEVFIDGQFVHKQRSDGLILATPTGTTAYALSAGGPILHPTLDAIALVPICPHTLSNRPIAIHSACKVEINLVHAEDAAVHLDGQLQMEVLPGDKVIVEKYQHAVALLHPKEHSHYDMLRQKLNWG
jgi:NAD+ kinase